MVGTGAASQLLPWRLCSGTGLWWKRQGLWFKQPMLCAWAADVHLVSRVHTQVPHWERGRLTWGGYLMGELWLGLCYSQIVIIIIIFFFVKKIAQTGVLGNFWQASQMLCSCFTIPMCTCGLMLFVRMSSTPSVLFSFPPLAVLFPPMCLLIFQDKNCEKIMQVLRSNVAVTGQGRLRSS